MKKILNYISLILVLSLLSTVLIGCSQGVQTTIETSKGTEDTNEEVKTPINVTYWIAMGGSSSAVVSSYSEVLCFQEIEKRTNVKVEFKHPPAGGTAAEEQFNLMIAGRDLPDIINYNWLVYPGGPEKAIGDNIIIKLNDIINDNAPAYKKILDDNPHVSKQVLTDQGSLAFFGGLNLGRYKGSSGLMLRKDWLDDLGLDVPDTIDEWTNVLRQFKEKKESTAPFTTIMAHIGNTRNMFNGAFNTGYDYYLVDGQVMYAPIEPGYKDYLSLLNEWYSEELLDPDFASIDDKTRKSNMLNGKSGATYGAIGGNMGAFLDQATTEGYDLVMAQYPVLNKGDTPRFTLSSNELQIAQAAITTACKEIESVARYLDYFYTDEGRKLQNFGVEGVTYEIADGQPKYMDLIMNNPDGLTVAQALSKYTQSNYPSIGFNNEELYLKQYYQEYPQQQHALEVISKYGDEWGKHMMMPPVSATPEESQELAALETEIKTFRDEMFLKFIMGTEPLDNFDQYVEQMKKMKVERTIELKQAAVDRYNNR